MQRNARRETNHGKHSSQGDWFCLEQGQGYPLVLLHGLGACSFSWRHNLEVLARDYQVLAPDLPGHGLTPAARGRDFRLETWCQEICRLLEARRVYQAALVGNSLGGALALLLARTYPQRFPVLALLAPAAALAKNLWILELLRFPGIGLGVAAALGPWILPLALRLVYHRRELITPEVMAGYAATFRPLANRLAFRRLSQQVRPWPLNLVEELMRDLHQPVCLIWGTEDRVLPVAQAHWLKARLPQAELHLLPGIGHVPQEEAPETVNKIIIAFLARSLKN